MNKHTSIARGPGAHATDRSDVREDRREFAEAARFYLQLEPRQLPSRFLYDTLGSALFDAICHLPWYRITRAELSALPQREQPVASARRPNVPVRDGVAV